MDVFVLLEQKKKKKKKVFFPPKMSNRFWTIFMDQSCIFFYFSPQCNFSHIWNHVLCFDSILFYKEMYN